MYRLKLNNVVKTTDSEHKMKELMAKGYKLTFTPSFKPSVTVISKPVTSETSEDKERVKCPYCDKDYAELKNLKEHIKKKHPDKLEK